MCVAVLSSARCLDEADDLQVKKLVDDPQEGTVLVGLSPHINTVHFVD